MDPGKIEIAMNSYLSKKDKRFVLLLLINHILILHLLSVHNLM